MGSLGRVFTDGNFLATVAFIWVTLLAFIVLSQCEPGRGSAVLRCTDRDAGDVFYVDNIFQSDSGYMRYYFNNQEIRRLMWGRRDGEVNETLRLTCVPIGYKNEIVFDPITGDPSLINRGDQS